MNLHEGSHPELAHRHMVVSMSAITRTMTRAASASVTPNFTSDLLVAPRNAQQGETLSLSRPFPQADGDTQSSLAFGLRRYQLPAVRLVRDLDQHTHPSASMAQHN